MRNRSRASLAALVGALAASCVPGQRPLGFPVRSGSTLELGRRGGNGASGPLKVTFAGPEGEDVETPQPQIVFSKPMRALGDPAQSPALPARFTPEVRGRWEWVGTSAARFVPEEGFVLATRYTLELSAGLRSVDGEALGEGVKIAFSTPRPSLASSWPESGREIGLADSLLIQLNQTVPRPALESSVSVVDRAGQPVPFALEQDGSTWSSHIQIKPKGRWPEGERLTLRFAGGVRGEEGELPMKPGELVFDTVPPMHVESVDCYRHDDGRCREGMNIDVQLSRDMRPSDLRRLVTITPAVKLRPPYDRSDTPTTYHSLEGDFVAGVTYRVVIEPSKRAPRPLPRPRKGQPDPEELSPLKQGATAELTFAPTEPGVHFSFSGTFVPPSQSEIAARAEETKQASAGAIALDREAVMRLEAGELGEPSGTVRWWELPGVKTVVLPARNSLKDPPAWLGLGPVTPSSPGPLLFGARWEGWSGEQSLSKILQRSDLALYARVSPEGALAWVTSLTSGKPVEGASVEARDGAGRRVSATTDRDGVALLQTASLGDPLSGEASEPHRAKKAGGEGLVVVFVQKGDDWVFRRVQVPHKARKKAALFTDRGLYRPGETALLKGVVRQPTSKGLVPIHGEEVKLSIREPSGRVTTTTARLSEFGTFHLEMPTGQDASLGSYAASAEMDGREIASARFKVMEYRPSAFFVESSLDKRSYTRGEPFVCSTRGVYMYGGSMKGAAASAYVSRQVASYQVPGLKGFTIAERERERLPEFPLGIRYASLDDAGTARFEAALDNPGQSGPELISCDVTVVDPGQERVAGASSALVHPAEVYAAIEDVRWGQVSPGQTLRPRVLAVTPEGVRKSQRVRLELWEHRKDPKVSWGTLPGVVVASCELTTKSEPETCSLAAPHGPFDEVRRFVVRATTRDGKGRSSSSSIELYPGQPPRPVPPPRPKPKVKPRPEAKLEASGEDHPRGAAAKLVARSPFAEGHMLFTVEREGVLEHKVQEVSTGPVPLEVAIDGATAPFVTAQAVFVSPYEDRTSSSRMMAAQATLKSGWADRRLEVTVRPEKTQASPGEQMTVAVDVRTASGKPASAEVTLYAADEATLQLARYELPDPLDGFFEGRERLVSEASTRSDLGHLFDWKAELAAWGRGVGYGVGYGSGHGRLGGSHRSKAPQVRMGATSVAQPRRNFNQSAFFFPSLVTDESGRASARVTLPDSLTTFRVMAFAVTKADEMGASQAPIVTSMPLQVRPLLPRVIRAGDRLTISAMAANNGPSKLDAKVSLELAGLEARGPAAAEAHLAAGEAKRVSFDVEALRPGKGKVVVKIAAGDGLGDSAEVPIEVEAPLSLEAAALYGAAQGQVDERLGDLSSARADVGSLDITLSASPLAGLSAGLEQLVDYPYGCTEQTTSRLVPLLSLRDLARALSVSLPPDLDQASREAVRRLLGNQARDGGFGLWPGSTSSSPWLSAYATWGLEESRRHRVPVDERALGRARVHLQELLVRWNDGPLEQATAPFALDVLSGAEGADRASLSVIAGQLFDARARMPLFSRALLLHAMAQIGSDRADLAALSTELSSGLHIDGPVARFVGSDPAHAPLLDSPVRTSALVLRALLAASPGHPLLTPLALGLLADRNGGTWRTTQEAAWALLALDDYRRAQGEAQATLDGQVLLGGSPLIDQSISAPPGQILPDTRLSLPIARLIGAPGQSLSFVGRGRGPLYYQARLRFAPRDLPRDDLASGLEIHRTYFLLPSGSTSGPPEGARADLSDFAEGAQIVSEIEVVAPSTRRFVAIEDPLPGGFESVDLDLEGGARWMRHYERSYGGGARTRTERRDDRVVFFADELSPGPHRYLHIVRATSAGRFIVPPARVEEMYTPETFGRTAARVVTVK